MASAKWFSSRRLKSNVSLWLVFALSGADLCVAVGTLPYVVYLLTAWNPVVLDYDATLAMIFNSPVVMQLKLNLVLTTAIAIDRIQVPF